jgi:hypothetical protein
MVDALPGDRGERPRDPRGSAAAQGEPTEERMTMTTTKQLAGIQEWLRADEELRTMVVTCYVKGREGDTFAAMLMVGDGMLLEARGSSAAEAVNRLTEELVISAGRILEVEQHRSWDVGR